MTKLTFQVVQALRSRAQAETGDRGAVLILVLGFVLLASVMSGAMLGAVSTDLGNTRSFSTARGLQYDAASATDLAIQAIRYTPQLSRTQTLNASPPSSCTSAATSTYQGSNGNSISVWCSTRWSPTSSSTRIVTLSACPSTQDVATCAARPVLQAVVTFDDYPPGLTVPTQGQCAVYCGAALSLTSWISYPTVPTVSSIGTSTGPASGGTSVSISGTGFVNGSTTVNFIEESNGVPTSHNIVLQGTSVSVGSSTSLTVTSPPVISGSTYFVSVTTPSGTSAYGPVFTFNPVTPTVTSLSQPAQGATVGGATFTINGTGFRTGSTVAMVSSGGTSVAATQVNVVSGTQLTAVTPSVTSAGTYNVVVTTTAGSSATSTASRYTYSVVVPTVNTVSPTTGGRTAKVSVTLTGSGFVSGQDTVAFTLIGSNGYTATNTSYSGTSVSVSSSSTLTVTTPSVTTAGSYYVTVTDNAGDTSSNYPVFQFT